MLIAVCVGIHRTSEADEFARYEGYAHRPWPIPHHQRAVAERVQRSRPSGNSHVRSHSGKLNGSKDVISREGLIEVWLRLYRYGCIDFAHLLSTSFCLSSRTTSSLRVLGICSNELESQSQLCGAMRRSYLLLLTSAAGATWKVFLMSVYPIVATMYGGKPFMLTRWDESRVRSVCPSSMLAASH